MQYLSKTLDLSVIFYTNNGYKNWKVSYISILSIESGEDIEDYQL